MGYLFTHLCAQDASSAFVDALKDFWTGMVGDHPCHHTVVRNGDRIFIDVVLNEGASFNQYILNVVLYDAPPADAVRDFNVLDTINGYSLRLDYDRLTPAPNCAQVYAKLLDAVVNKLENICRKHKLNLLLDE